MNQLFLLFTFNSNAQKHPASRPPDWTSSSCRAVCQTTSLPLETVVVSRGQISEETWEQRFQSHTYRQSQDRWSQWLWSTFGSVMSPTLYEILLPATLDMELCRLYASYCSVYCSFALQGWAWPVNWVITDPTVCCQITEKHVICCSNQHVTAVCGSICCHFLLLISDISINSYYRNIVIISFFLSAFGSCSFPGCPS